MGNHRSADGAWLAVLLAIATLTAAGWPAQTHAQTVQKCIDTAGHVTLTSAQCADGQELAGTYDAVPEPAVPGTGVKPISRQELAGPASRSGATARAVARSTRPRARARGKPAPDRCQAARDRREQTLRRVGLKRTFDLLRKLDDEVRAACH